MAQAATLRHEPAAPVPRDGGGGRVDGAAPDAAKPARKLGRKGQETRERIVCAFLRLMAEPDGAAVTLTSVARAAEVRLPNLYVYFPDMGELLLTGLARVMATAEDGYLELLRQRWPGEGLQSACLAFLRAHFGFWRCHARILHMRNALADAGDARLFRHRQDTSRPLIDMIKAQMDSADASGEAAITAIATVLLTGIERTATVLTSPSFPRMSARDDPASPGISAEALIAAEAEVIALAIAARRRPAA